jgi:hypothetical protein
MPLLNLIQDRIGILIKIVPSTSIPLFLEHGILLYILPLFMPLAGYMRIYCRKIMKHRNEPHLALLGCELKGFGTIV